MTRRSRARTCDLFAVRWEHVLSLLRETRSKTSRRSTCSGVCFGLRGQQNTRRCKNQPKSHEHEQQLKPEAHHLQVRNWSFHFQGQQKPSCLSCGPWVWWGTKIVRSPKAVHSDPEGSFPTTYCTSKCSAWLGGSKPESRAQNFSFGCLPVLWATAADPHGRWGPGPPGT